MSPSRLSSLPSYLGDRVFLGRALTETRGALRLPARIHKLRNVTQSVTSSNRIRIESRIAYRSRDHRRAT